ncbi:MalY/PatB family protein [Pallidibacillus pasinlerensis]|uniref:cysteine-S-conjugate beta-lyase n=1 Tax=Pallidibacillus pasinlerensis TaxID=2703818 RepID=A0ABX0A2L6_9BACI|nr:MalY/PatB family protein [Pallidibacillus pasinlerensis]NCU17652.1 pyridoxal phosphate-dependent aminotransferase [Pallidibacillus pasinlerensis]
MFNFDEHINRLNTDSVKWNATKAVYGTDDILPMWVADMDFASPPHIKEALMKRVEHGIFGYGMPSSQLNTVISNWVANRYKWEIKENWLMPSSGVVSAIGFAIQALTEVGDKVLIQTPVYHPFYFMIENNEREIVKNPLVLKDGKYEIDFVDFEEKLKSGVKLFILCSPHNPVGRVWTREELEKMGELCEQYGVYIVSDEIHADIIYKPNVHTPIASLNESWENISITCIAPSKTFNIPGLQASMMIIPNGEIRKKVQAVQGKVGYHGLNIFGNVALEAAYKHGEEWLEALLPYLQRNRDTVIEFVSEELPELVVTAPEGTYLMWVDCRGLGLNDEEIKERLIQRGKLGLEPGNKYGTDGTGFVRMNIGCTYATLQEGLHRLKRAFK